MKALSFTQPWATLLATGHKRIETRSWGTAYRGELAIQAAKRFPADCKDLCYGEPFKSCLGMPADTELLWRPPEPAWVKEAKEIVDNLPRGFVIGQGRLVDCIPANAADLSARFPRTFSVTEEMFGNYGPGRFAWIFEDLEMFFEFVPAKGALGLWEWRHE